MKKYFLVKLSHLDKADDGSISTVTENYIVLAMTYSDAETLAYEYAEQYWAGSFRILSVARQNITEGFGLDGSLEGDVFKLKYEFESEVDSRLNKIKSFTEHYYVVAPNLVTAIQFLEGRLQVDSSVLFCGVTGGSKLKITDYICDEIESQEDAFKTLDRVIDEGSTDVD